MFKNKLFLALAAEYILKEGIMGNICMDVL